MKKKVLSLLLIACMLLACGCGKENNDKKETTKKEESSVKTLRCVDESKRREIDEDDDGNSIYGVQGTVVEYKYDTKKKEIVGISGEMYVKYENVSSDYFKDQYDDAKEACNEVKEDPSIIKCEVKKEDKKLIMYMEADIDKALEEEDLTKTSTLEEVKAYLTEDNEDYKCTIE